LKSAQKTAFFCLFGQLERKNDIIYWIYWRKRFYREI